MMMFYPHSQLQPEGFLPQDGLDLPWMSEALIFFLLIFYSLHIVLTFVSKSDILGPNGNLSDIKNLVSFKREIFADSIYKYRIKFLFLAHLSTKCSG